MRGSALGFVFFGVVSGLALQAHAIPNCPQNALARGVCDPDPDPDPDPPPPPPPFVSIPDAAFQISPCLPSTLEGQVGDAVRTVVPAGAEVRVACVNGTERIGAWLMAMAGRDDAAARSRGLSALSILGASETFAAKVGSAAILRNAYAQWNAAAKRLNGDGNPDPNGPVHLTGFTPRFTAPNTVSATITGFDERPWPDVDFTLATTDSLSVGAGRVQCQSATSFDVDTSVLNVLTGVFGILVPPLGLVFGIEDIIVSGADAPSTTRASLGGPAVQFFPGTILLPLGLKATATYSRVGVDGSGITAGGSFSVSLRSPVASISGPRTLSAATGVSAVGSYSAITNDMRPPLRYSWSASGSVSQPSAFGTRVTFGSGAKTGSVSVTVSDADSLSATSTISVSIRSVDPDDGGDPPVCRKKPYLPQCQVP
jgi:hypothetical protein